MSPQQRDKTSAGTNNLSGRKGKNIPSLFATLGGRSATPSMLTHRQNSHCTPRAGFPPCSDSGLCYKPSQTLAWKRSSGFSQSLRGGGRSPGEDQSPPCCCKVPVGIFLTPAFVRCCRSNKALEKERQCPLNPVQLDLLSHSVLMPGKNVLM